MFVHGGPLGQLVTLVEGSQSVGRTAEMAVQLADGSVSREHALIRVDPAGRCWLRDLGSTNGTFVNGHRLLPDEVRQLRDGDRIGLGPNVVLKLLRTDSLDEQHHRQMFERTARDPLTGLYNRGYFLDEVNARAQRVYRCDLGMALLVIDLDHFKRVNDTYGHDVGDAVLRSAAAALRRSTRTDDLVARLGGEEFVAALPCASPEQALARAERMRRAVRDSSLLLRDQKVAVTASIGVAFSPHARPRGIAQLLREADQALYRAKAAGRDRTLVAALPDAPTPPSAVAPPTAGLTTVDYELTPQ
jgi:diguanylate cyclase (GGDEF)-like protein